MYFRERESVLGLGAFEVLDVVGTTGGGIVGAKVFHAVQATVGIVVLHTILYAIRWVTFNVVNFVLSFPINMSFSTVVPFL